MPESPSWTLTHRSGSQVRVYGPGPADDAWAAYHWLTERMTRGSVTLCNGTQRVMSYEVPGMNGILPLTGAEER